MRVDRPTGGGVLFLRRICCYLRSTKTRRTRMPLSRRNLLFGGTRPCRACRLRGAAPAWNRARAADGAFPLRAHRRRMAQAADRCRIRRAARAWHRAPLHLAAQRRAPRRHLRLRRLRPAALFLRDQIRQRHRLAELLRPDRGRHRHLGGQHPVHDRAPRSIAPIAADISAMSSRTAPQPTGLRYCMNGVALHFVAGLIAPAVRRAARAFAVHFGVAVRFRVSMSCFLRGAKLARLRRCKDRIRERKRESG